MSYILTQEDIDRYYFADAVAGDVALPEELKVMGMSQEAAPVTPAAPAASNGPAFGGDPTYTAARDAGLDVDDAVKAQDPSVRAGPAINANPSFYTQEVSMPPAGGASSMADLLSQPIPQDPLEGLSRNQRMMLGFAAMKDAGMALMGKDSNTVSAVMGDFNDRADMERKRRAAAAGLKAEERQRAALMEMLGAGPSIAGSAPLGTGEGIRARIQQLTLFAAANPDAAAGLVPEIQRLQGEAERVTQLEGEVQSSQMMLGQLDALLFDPDLERALGIEGFFRKLPSELGLDTDTARVRGRIDQIKGGAFLQAFKSLKGGGQITEIEGQKAEQAEARLDTAQNLTDFTDALKEYRFYIDQGIRRKMGEDIPLDTLYKSEKGAADPLGIRE